MPPDRDSIARQPETPATSVLLIEDEASVARITELVLRSDGYAVDIGRDLASGEHLMASKHYDLVLADTEHGAAVRALTGLAEFARLAAPTPVVVFSAHRFSQQEVAAAGLAGAISKPYDVDDLIQGVMSVLGRSRLVPRDGEAQPSP
jgi:DNA-binding response OmpR family regulator